jgi:iron complex transport system substrate-binding protein
VSLYLARRAHRPLVWICASLWLWSSTCWAAAAVPGPGDAGQPDGTGIEVQDDTGRWLRLAAPVQRIVSLSPHLTEMLFDLGVGDRVVGTVSYSDYPQAAQQIPRVGDAFSVNVEAVLALAPDIVIAWQTGGANRALEKLRSLGMPIYVNEAPTLASIAASARQLSLLAGVGPRGEQLAVSFEQRLQKLRRPQGPTRVFFQISDQNLYTVNNQHLIGQALNVCGATNIFGGVDVPVPLVSQEAVIGAGPQLIFYTQLPGQQAGDWVDRWAALLPGVSLVPIDPNIISRPSLRMLVGIELICKAISQI